MKKTTDSKAGILKYHKFYVTVIMIAALVAAFAFFSHRGIATVEKVFLFNNGFNTVAMFASVTLLICCMLDGMQKKENRRNFMAAIFFNFLAMILDSVTYVMHDLPEYIIPHLSLTPLIFVFDALATYATFEYIISIINLRGEKNAEIMRKISIVGMLFAIALSVTNYFYPLYYTVDAIGDFQFTPLYQLNYIYKLLIQVFIVYVVIRYIKRLKANMLIAFISYAASTVARIVLAERVEFFMIDYAVAFLIYFIMYIMINVENGTKSALTEVELDTARKIQKGILPNVSPDYDNVEEFNIGVKMESAREVGGDFYDFFMIDRDRLAIVIGDVRGRGVSAALFMAVAKTMINMRAQHGGTPSSILENVNEQIIQTNRQNMTVSIWLGIMDLCTGHISYCNAGAESPAFLVKDKSGSYEYDSEEAQPSLGSALGMKYTGKELDMSPDDKLFVYNKGLIKASSEDGIAYGRNRLLNQLNKNTGVEGEELLDEVYSNLMDFLGDTSWNDDITALSFTFKEKRRRVRHEETE